MDIFVAIPSYADPDLPRTIDSAVRASSGQQRIHISVAEQVTQYAVAYLLDRRFDEHVDIDVALVPKDVLVGLAGARSLAEACYAGEAIQIQIDSHVRFETDWDVSVATIVGRAGPGAVISGVASDPWAWRHHVPVSCTEAITKDGMLTGRVEMVEVERLDELLPARNVIPGGAFGASWCDQVPSDPHILFDGEDGALAAKLWTRGRTLWHSRVPWYTARRNSYSDHKASDHPEWTDRYYAGLRRARALLTGNALDDDDPAAVDFDRYGLGQARTLDAWLEYAGLDFEARTVRTPWP